MNEVEAKKEKRETRKGRAECGRDASKLLPGALDRRNKKEDEREARLFVCEGKENRANLIK
ncbi:hypothetical protein HAX54_036112, partial [Datura stramonium]|nr:hypothetical protein [Datura stramonium]